MKNKIKVICRQCGKKFEVIGSRAKKYKTRMPIKYCSRNCYYKGKVVQQKRICKVCGKEFHAKRCLVKNKKYKGGIYCSLNCMHKGSKTGFVKQCEICGKPFRTTPYNVKRQGGRFCSWKCSRAWINKNKARTKIENLIDKELQKNSLDFTSQCHGFSFTVPDFYIPKWEIVIYCDGEYWHSRPEIKKRDNTQDLILGLNGYKVFRFKEKEIYESPQKCIKRVLRYIKKQGG